MRIVSSDSENEPLSPFVTLRKHQKSLDTPVRAVKPKTPRRLMVELSSSDTESSSPSPSPSKNAKDQDNSVGALINRLQEIEINATYHTDDCIFVNYEEQSNYQAAHYPHSPLTTKMIFQRAFWSSAFCN